MPTSSQMAAIRKTLGFTQEQMATVLNVSFVSVNRWERGRTRPSGPTLDLYIALETALGNGHSPESIRQAANNDRGGFLFRLFQMAYTSTVRRHR
ncbi:MAG TPA: helix-turn-helix transcriptional regulator [Candidatus Acidoferrum sp.]|nr:helix-turn-helix transcriptional regulator [Candidatus Acidoferrum sp.]